MNVSDSLRFTNDNQSCCHMVSPFVYRVILRYYQNFKLESKESDCCFATF